ncbi:MAG: calcium-translocating P-type ATPase, SERCA-type [Candidatus Woesearchaeota archaeon]
MAWFDQSVPAVLRELGVSPTKGLSDGEAKSRLEKYGKNSIEEAHKISLIKIFLNQFASPIVWILLAAMLICALIPEWTDFWVIAAIVILNAILGCLQEYRAEEAIEALKKMVSLKAKVLREGKVVEIDASEIVPGDIILLETGDKVPADARLIETVNLSTQEATLTGESTPVLKNTETLHDHVSVADQHNMVFSGTIVTSGRGKAVVVSTGVATEIGKIAKMIKETKAEPTPLQKKLASLSKMLGVLVIIIALVVFGAGVFYGLPVFEMFLAAIALAVAAIPEGLPAVVTVALALGVQRMAKCKALVRKLPSVETLGTCSVICADKTGTMTHNQMTVKYVFANQESIPVSGSGYSPIGRFAKNPDQFGMLLKIGALNNNAKVEQENNEWKVIGDPTEAALIVSARKAGINVEQLNITYPRLREIEFTSERKIMTTVHRMGAKMLVCTKGAPEVIVKLCTRQLVNGKIVRFSRSDAEKVLAMNEAYANRALRVLGFAYKQVVPGSKEKLESDMIFVGLQAMIDPPRTEVKEAIQKCEIAGIKVVMITGDHLTTAKAIAKELGITGKAITGVELDHITDLEPLVEEINVYARVNPAHKIRIVEALQKKGHVVAMTGDGVNDAPALKKADLGIAMGITGTDVAKEASAMVLADDNFATIVRAVEEGRVIFDNIKKFVEYLLSSNMGEVLTLFTGILLGWPLPVTALMILWINLVTDGAPALALGIDPAEPGVMKRQPRKIEENIVNKSRGTMILLIGLIMMLGTLFVFDLYEPELQLAKAQTMAFTTLMLFQMFNVLNQRSETESLFVVGFFKNRWLWLAIMLSVGLQFAVVYVPFFQHLFGTVSLGVKDWLIAVGVSASVLVFGEIVKMIKR